MLFSSPESAYFLLSRQLKNTLATPCRVASRLRLQMVESLRRAVSPFLALSDIKQRLFQLPARSAVLAALIAPGMLFANDQGLAVALSPTVPDQAASTSSEALSGQVDERTLPGVRQQSSPALRLMQQIEALEIEHGPYDIRLKEALYGLGQQLDKTGESLAASEAYNRALHISRINEGLNNESQLAIVERLIGVEQQMARWEQVDSHFEYLEYLYKKLYDKTDPRLETGLRKVVAWHLDASNYNLNGRRVEHLRKAHGLLKLRLEMAEQTRSEEDPLLNSLKRNIAQSEYFLYLSSDLYQEMSRERRRYARDRYLATLD